MQIHYNSPGSKAQAEKTVKELHDLGVKAAAFQGNLTKVLRSLFVVAWSKLFGP